MMTPKISAIITLSMIMLLSASGTAVAENQFMATSGLAPVFAPNADDPSINDNEVDFTQGMMSFKVAGNSDHFTLKVKMNTVTGIPNDVTHLVVGLDCQLNGQLADVKFEVPIEEALDGDDLDRVRIKIDGVLSEVSNADLVVVNRDVLAVVGAYVWIRQPGETADEPVDTLVAGPGFVFGPMWGR